MIITTGSHPKALMGGKKVAKAKGKGKKKSKPMKKSY
jgi:hypothetical protein